MSAPGRRLDPDSAEYAEYVQIALEKARTRQSPWVEGRRDEDWEITVDVYEVHAIVAFKTPPRSPLPPPTIENNPDGSVTHRRTLRSGGASHYLIFIDVKTKIKVRHGLHN